MGYGSDYAANVSNLLLRKGEAAANARLRSGDAWAGALGQIGQTIASIPAQIAQQKAQSQQATLRQDEIDKLESAKKQQRILADAYQQSLNPDGTLNRPKLTTTLTQAGLGAAVPDLMKGLDEAESANLAVSKAKSDAKQASESAELGYAKTLGSQMLASEFNPEIVNGLLAVAKSHGHDVRQFETLWTKQPEQFKSFVSKLVQPPKAAEPFTLNPGDVRFDANGQPIANNPKPDVPVTFGAPTPAMVGGKRVFVRTGSDGQTYDMKGQPIAVEPTPIPPERAPEKPTYEWAQDSKGNVRLMTPQEIRGEGGTKPISAAEAMDSRKFAKVKPVIDKLSTLSELINTKQGIVAKASGEAEKAKASLNLNDDVAEYQAIISGFTPMVARAVGHTGVLTQMDVDSVKEMFPKPGDSKSLRDRKIATLTTIMGNLEQVTGNKTGKTDSTVSVTAPDGQTYHFPNQAAADAFKKAAGIK